MYSSQKLLLLLLMVLKKGGKVRKFCLEKSMTGETKGYWGEMRCLKPIGIYNGDSEANLAS